MQKSKEEQCQRFEILMAEIFEQHAMLMEKMHRDHQLEKDELEQSKKQLSAEIESMITEDKRIREKVEAESWEQIDRKKEIQKEELARMIDQGMKQKSELSLIATNFKQKKAEKENIKNEIE